MSVQSDLLAEIETFLAECGGMAETTFGILAVNDGKLIGRVRKGNVTLATLERIKKYIRDQRVSRGVSHRAKPKPRTKQPSAVSAPSPQGEAA